MSGSGEDSCNEDLEETNEEAARVEAWAQEHLDLQLFKQNKSKLKIRYRTPSWNSNGYSITLTSGI
jgi:hypothetical protein